MCSKPAGNTDHGLCDMVGNGYQWLQDLPHPDYRGAPADGSAWETLHPGTRRMPDTGSPERAARGSDWESMFPRLETTARFKTGWYPETPYGHVGFRTARSIDGQKAPSKAGRKAGKRLLKSLFR